MMAPWLVFDDVQAILPAPWTRRSFCAAVRALAPAPGAGSRRPSRRNTLWPAAMLMPASLLKLAAVRTGSAATLAAKSTSACLTRSLLGRPGWRNGAELTRLDLAPLTLLVVQRLTCKSDQILKSGDKSDQILSEETPKMAFKRR